MKFGQLIEYNIKNIFSWKIIQRMWWRNYFQTLFWKIKIGHISGSIVYSFTQFMFIICQVEGYQNILKLSRKPLACTSYYIFLRNDKRSRTSLPASFSVKFLEKKCFSSYILLIGQVSLSGCLYFARY